MIWASLDLDILEDPAFMELEEEVPGAFWLWVRILQQAKRVNQQGLVLRADGRPLGPRELQRIHHVASLDTWAGLLDRCVELELLALEDGVYRIVDWRRWHKSPSDHPAQVSARVAKHRANRRGIKSEDNVTSDVTACNACNECNDTQHSTAQQVHNTSKKSSSSTRTAKLAREARKTSSGLDSYSASLNGYAVSPLPGVDLSAQARAEALYQASMLDPPSSKVG